MCFQFIDIFGGKFLFLSISKNAHSSHNKVSEGKRSLSLLWQDRDLFHMYFGIIRNIPNWKQIRREEQKVNHVNKTIKKSPNLGEAACNLVRHWLWEWLQISNRKYPFQNMFKRKLQAVYFHRYIKSSLLHNFGNILLKSKWVFPINEFCKYHRILWEFCN